MSAGARAHGEPRRGPDHSGLDELTTRQLEAILVELLIVKYPGIEEQDIDRFFHALNRGAIDQVEQIEADLAQKSAIWRQARGQDDLGPAGLASC
jgi:hypothetical protein